MEPTTEQQLILFPKATRPNQKPIRYRKVKSQCSIKSAAATVEANFGLPAGSVKLVRPDGRKMRSNATVRALRAAWALAAEDA